jgi:hypothetical protein
LQLPKAKFLSFFSPLFFFFLVGEQRRTDQVSVVVETLRASPHVEVTADGSMVRPVWAARKTVVLSSVPPSASQQEVDEFVKAATGAASELPLLEQDAWHVTFPDEAAAAAAAATLAGRPFSASGGAAVQAQLRPELERVCMQMQMQMQMQAQYMEQFMYYPYIPPFGFGAPPGMYGNGGHGLRGTSPRRMSNGGMNGSDPMMAGGGKDRVFRPPINGNGGGGPMLDPAGGGRGRKRSDGPMNGGMPGGSSSNGNSNGNSGLSSPSSSGGSTSNGPSSSSKGGRPRPSGAGSREGGMGSPRSPGSPAKSASVASPSSGAVAAAPGVYPPPALGAPGAAAPASSVPGAAPAPGAPLLGQMPASAGLVRNNSGGRKAASSRGGKPRRSASPTPPAPAPEVPQ